MSLGRDALNFPDRDRSGIDTAAARRFAGEAR